MYLHVGTGKIVRKKEIIGIFDLDRTTLSSITKRFLSQSEKEGKVCSVNSDIPRSFVLTENGTIYISRVSSQASASRAEKGEKLLLKKHFNY